MKYPLRYGQAFEDKGSQRNITINTAAGSQTKTLNFAPNQSILLKVTGNGTIEEIDLKFAAKKIGD